MVSQKKIGLLIIILFTIVASIIAINATIKSARDYVSLTIATIAILVAVFSLFKNYLLADFKLKVLAGDALILNNPQNPVIDLILTVSFINEGHTDGVIEFIALKVTNSKGNKKLYIACNELDSKLVYNLIQQPQAKASGNIPFPFSAFPIPSRQSIKKHLGFAWSSNSSFTDWGIERYKFELYLKSSSWKKLKKVSEFKHEMTLNDFNSYTNQESYYMAGILERSLVKQVNEL